MIQSEGSGGSSFNSPTSYTDNLPVVQLLALSERRRNVRSRDGGGGTLSLARDASGLGESVFPMLVFIRRLKSLPMLIYLGWKVSPPK